MKIRKPAVAGRFYPGSAQEINDQLDDILIAEKDNLTHDYQQNTIIGGVVPHAGYMFSAYQAMHFFDIIKKNRDQFDTFVIINPNHTGYGAEIALDDSDFWETPFGNVEIDHAFYDYLKFGKSAAAHKYEHSGEVMVPMLQHQLDYEFKILPITLSNQTPDNAQFVAKKLYEANLNLQKKIAVIASSDFSHYVEPKHGRELDDFVVKQILDLNSAGINREVKQKNISVCGFGAIMALVEYAKLICDNPKTEILRRGHSGDIMPSSEVVDYISFLFYY